MEQITKNVYVETGKRGCNHSFVVTSEGIVVIDVPVDRDDAKAWVKEIAKHGKTRYVIITESHFDHCMNNDLFGAEVIASQITSDIIREVNTEPYLKARTKYFYNHPLPVPSAAELKKGWPSITFNDRMTLHLGEHTIQVMFLPGHTAGQTSVYVPEEKVLFVADNVHAHPGAALHDGFPDKWLASLEVYKMLDVNLLMTGHTGAVAKKDIKKVLDQQVASIRERWDAIKKAKADGLTVDEAVERLAKVFSMQSQLSAMSATQDFRPPKSGDNSQVRRWVSHMYHVTGGNVTEIRKTL